MRVTLGLVVLLATLASVDAVAQDTVFLVRHAERADAGMASTGAAVNDPDLSAEGRARADSLAMMLKDADVTAIYATEFKRTQQTAAPLAKALGLTVTIVKAAEPTKLVEALRSAAGNVLVVGHSNTVPDVVRFLGVRASITIGEAEYDNLFVVTTRAEPRMIRLRFR
jgi:broad specificity phosphatase PhoE